MKICCLGDSLTAGYGVRPENCWVSLLNHRTSYTWINCGIPGDTSLGMLTRLRTDILPQKPDLSALQKHLRKSLHHLTFR